MKVLRVKNANDTTHALLIQDAKYFACNKG